MAEPEAQTGEFERRLRAVAGVVAPTTAVGALLFYFGYVSSRAQFEYFGIDVDTIGMGTRDYIMRSPQPLLVPLLVLTVIGIFALLLHASTLRRIEAASDGGVERLTWTTRRIRNIGVVVLGLGFVLLFVYPAVRDWPLYDLATPLLIALGGALTAYYSHVLELLHRRTTGRAPKKRGAAAPPPYAIALRAAMVLIYVVIAASVFWATATVAQWTGRGLARHQAQTLDKLPSVILDSKERLFLRSPGIDETVLPSSEGQTFHYRYRNLRLLIEGHDRMFLVPVRWSASDSTVVVPFDGSARVQFQFVNQRP